MTDMRWSPHLRPGDWQNATEDQMMTDELRKAAERVVWFDLNSDAGAGAAIDELRAALARESQAQPPPALPEPLSDEQIADGCGARVTTNPYCVSLTSWTRAVRWAERTHGIGAAPTTSKTASTPGSKGEGNG